MREPKNQMLGTMERPLMQLSVKVNFFNIIWLCVYIDSDIAYCCF